MIIYTPPKPALSIPVIDLGGSFSPSLDDRKAVTWEIHKACRETGFFYVKNHGIPQDLIDAQIEWTQRFFALPMEQKLQIDIKNSNWMRGYEAMAMQTLDAGSPPDLKEGMMIGRELSPDHPWIKAKVRHQGPNQWPSEPAGFREQMERYLDRMVNLGKHLMRCVALSLELPENWFDNGMAEYMATLRLLHYPPHPQNAAFNQLGAGAHTDWGSITMLLQDDCGGLEVQNADGEWIRATPIRGTFVVNLGDMIQRWTNDLYKSTMHRVLNNMSGRDRYSVPVFLNPDYFYRVECLPTCRPERGEPKYLPCTVGEHIAEMFRRTYEKVAIS
jgi:isopenicillin N synthase-like dioxygenase